ncbi:MAG: phage tail sheath subtilisin-like domain-containing protein [Bacteroidales bacterium]|nr:phage tail sheath subtilisin-like domain-containing protein [Bacteroidales bacterium]
MANYSTPGVYIEEISKLPASVAPVATAIPAFVGYTEKSVKKGVTLPANTPVRITSLLEYEEIFGKAFDEALTVTLTGTGVTEEKTSIAVAATTKLSPYILYYNLVMYFANGGGPCYVVSVGTYTPDPVPADPSTLISLGALQAGLAAVEKEDEVTLLVVPDAIILNAAGRKTINDDMLTQCSVQQDRFALIDARVLGGTVFDDGVGFRADVGADYLKYGACYYPSLKTTIDLNFEDSGIAITDSRTGAVFTGGRSLDDVNNGIAAAVAATGTIAVDDYNLLAGDVVTINGHDFTEGVDWNAGSTNIQAATSLHTAITSYADAAYTATRVSGIITLTANTAGATGNSITLAYTDNGDAGIIISGANLAGGSNGVAPDKTLYNNIVKEIKKLYKITLYPSSAMAGVFARVDYERGVWKAPANVSLRLVKEPTVLVTHEQQMDMNVDATSGKSINIIRKFAGKGSIVWGARTLAGNDNEWRYVPVRRFYNFVEESVKKATEFVVFEPNDAKTWLRTKTMIENFLVTLWRQGALAGAKTDEAFFVKVGLGETMTALDILEGRMNVEIGMAVVRPAEFIILKFSHKLQES